MASVEDLKKELQEIEQKLADPGFVVDYKKVAEASKRYAEIQRILENPNQKGSGSGSNEAIVEIRAGTGGDEAALFAASLFEMYKKYALSRGWSMSVIDSSQ